MRIKYPIDNLENRKWAMTNNIFEIRLSNLQRFGYMLKHGDFSNEIKEASFSDLKNCTPYDFCEMEYGNYDVMYYEEQKELILITIDFIINYLSIDLIGCIINDPREVYSALVYKPHAYYKQKIKNIIVEYVEENKEEFPEVYLELMLGD